mmetsp:Transcript_21288/g.52748  ORF Transcript_21288/g.52748 Transcript_21288/m.52748 type:complete len:115 (-) Transcript_21288:290-634(-)
MSSYTSTGSIASIMDDASTASTSRSRSNSLYENSTTHTSQTRRRSNSLFENSPSTNAHRRTKSINNSVVQAMITSNNLRNCREVQEMVVQCLNNKDDKSFMCQTAQRYIGGCQK